MTMRRVRPWLFVGTEPSGSAQDNALMELGNVTHVVRCMHGSTSEAANLVEPCITTTACREVVVAVDDVADTNLLKLLVPPLEALAQVKREHDIAKANDFKKCPAVLVYCQAGVSRSVSVVTAALMCMEKLPFETAMAIVKKKRPEAEPNTGFVSQLQLLERLEWTLDYTHPLYRQFLLDFVGQEDPKEDHDAEPWNAVDDGYAGEDPGVEDADLSNSVVYRCRSCKRPVITDEDIQDREGLPTNEDVLWITPVTWMLDSIIGVSQGKLMCPNPKCDARLGRFNWVGITVGDPTDRFRWNLPDPVWVSPAFQIIVNKVHKVIPAHAPDLVLGNLAMSTVRLKAPDFESRVAYRPMALEYKARKDSTEHAEESLASSDDQQPMDTDDDSVGKTVPADTASSQPSQTQ